jgi:hypothetical protein
VVTPDARADLNPDRTGSHTDLHPIRTDLRRVPIRLASDLHFLLLTGAS